MKLSKLLLEMLVVGLSLVIVSLAIEFAQHGGRLVSWDKTHFRPMVIGIFAAGATLHFVFELSGINHWYAKQYEPLLK